MEDKILNSNQSDEVLEFISRRFKINNNWCTGNCYWFAIILKNRFPQFKIYLLPVENHFLAGDGNRFYDWEGLKFKEDLNEEPIDWNLVPSMDQSYYNRLIRDCVN